MNEFLVKQEAKVQREEYATEVRRLQKIVRKLRILYKKVLDDNSEVARLRDDVPALTAKIQKQEASVTVRSLHLHICHDSKSSIIHLQYIPKYRPEQFRFNTLPV